MKIWFPCIDDFGGIRKFTETLASELTAAGDETKLTLFPARWQYMPVRLRGLVPPAAVDVIVADSWVAHALRRSPARLVVCEHHTVHDPQYARFFSRTRRLLHELVLRPLEKTGYEAADAVVAVSHFTAASVRREFPGIEPQVIHHGIDTGYYIPGSSSRQPPHGRPTRLFFAGHLTRRKGAEMLPRIMQSLGPGYELYYTNGARTRVELEAAPNIYPLGHVSEDEVRDELQHADIFLLPTRFESFGIAMAEALSCGTPVVASVCSAIPEVVDDGVTGILCPVDDVEGFAAAIHSLASEPERLNKMSRAARNAAIERLDRKQMAAAYRNLFYNLPG